MAEGPQNPEKQPSEDEPRPGQSWEEWVEERSARMKADMDRIALESSTRARENFRALVPDEEPSWLEPLQQAIDDELRETSVPVRSIRVRWSKGKARMRVELPDGRTVEEAVGHVHAVVERTARQLVARVAEALASGAGDG